MSDSKNQPRGRALKARRERFCQLYATHWNATRAAKEAGYSEKCAMELGYQLLQKTSVKARIAEITEHALSEIGVNRGRVLKEMACIAFLDPASAYDRLGQLIPIEDMPEDTRRAIAKMKVLERFDNGPGDKELVGFIKEIEFAPKKAALDSIAKVLGMTPDKIEHSGPNGKPIEHKSLSDVPDADLDARIEAFLSRVPPQETE